MAYIYGIEELLDINAIGIIFELLLVTSCVSTILFLLTKNQYISYLSAAPIFFLFSTVQYGITHLLLLIISMMVQGVIILGIQHRWHKNLVVDKKEQSV